MNLEPQMDLLKPDISKEKAISPLSGEKKSPAKTPKKASPKASPKKLCSPPKKASPRNRRKAVSQEDIDRIRAMTKPSEPYIQ